MKKGKVDITDTDEDNGWIEITFRSPSRGGKDI